MGAVSLLEAICGTSVDLKGLEAGWDKAEKISEEGLSRIGGKFTLLGIGIATTITGVIIAALEKATHTTAEWGLEMEHLSNRMGMTVRETGTLVGIMERFGVNANIGARAMQMLSMQIRNTQESLDPFATKLGRNLGTLRDTNGQVLNMVQVLELARQKISAATSDSDRLRIATELFGVRIGGQLVPMLRLSNEEWQKQKESVEANLGPIEKAATQALAYKQATAELEQAFRKLQIEVGTRTLPTMTTLVDVFSGAVENIKGVLGATSIGGLVANLSLGYSGVKATREEMKGAAEESERLAESSERVAQEIQLTEQNERKIVAMVRERVSLEEKALNLGMGSAGSLRESVTSALAKLEEQRLKLQEELGAKGLTPDQQLRIETEILKVKVEEAETEKRGREALYKREEEAIKYARELRMVSVDVEIDYRKRKAAELIGKGDIFGASAEIIKTRDLVIQQADQVMELTKKIRVVSLQDEIEYQKQKLELVKGNAEEEMKILTKIADLDKTLYDERLQFSLGYTQSIMDQFKRVQDAASKKGDIDTFDRARIDSDRALIEATRTAGDVLHGGGTTEQRAASVQFAQFVNKQIEQMESMGKTVSSIWRDAADVAKDILKAASGGEEVRAPGGPSPTIGSLLSPAEGLATEGLARGSDIPRLDTSFTDLAVRVRDVLLGTIPNVQNFSNAVQSAAVRIAALTGTPLNPGIVGPGGGTSIVPTQGSVPLATSGLTTGPTSSPSGGATATPAAQVGIGGNTAFIDVTRELSNSVKALKDAQDLTRSVQQDAIVKADENNQSLIDAVRAAISSSSKVSLSFDPRLGELFIQTIEQELSK